MDRRSAQAPARHADQRPKRVTAAIPPPPFDLGASQWTLGAGDPLQASGTRHIRRTRDGYQMPAGTSTALPEIAPSYVLLANGQTLIDGEPYTYQQELDLRPRPANLAAMSNGIHLVQTAETHRRFVEKRIKYTRSSRARVLAEVAALRQIGRHGGSSYINTMYDTCLSPRSGTQKLLLQYCAGGSLELQIRSFKTRKIEAPEELIWLVYNGIARALAFCHYGVRISADGEHISPADPSWDTLCHLDVKPGNVFLMHSADGNIDRAILGDFGCVVTKTDIETGSANITVQEHGTQGWYPPECPVTTNTRARGPTYGKPTDLWQMGGVIQALCLLLDLPDLEMAKSRTPCGTDQSEKLNLLVRTCMHPDPHSRTGAPILAQAITKERNATLM